MASPETSSLEGRLLARASRVGAGARAIARADRHSGSENFLNRATARHASRALRRAERSAGLPGIGLASLLARRLGGESVARSGFGWSPFGSGLDLGWVHAAPPWQAVEEVAAPVPHASAPWIGANVIPLGSSSTILSRAAQRARRSSLAAASGLAVPARPLTARRQAAPAWSAPSLALPALPRAAGAGSSAGPVASALARSAAEIDAAWQGAFTATAPTGVAGSTARYGSTAPAGVRLSRSVAAARDAGVSTPGAAPAGRPATPALARAALRGQGANLARSSATFAGAARAAARSTAITADPTTAALRRSAGLPAGGRGFDGARAVTRAAAAQPGATRSARLAWRAPDLSFAQAPATAFLGAPTDAAPAGAWTERSLARAAAASAPIARFGRSAPASSAVTAGPGAPLPGSSALLARRRDAAARAVASAGPPPLARALAGGSASSGPGARALARAADPGSASATPGSVAWQGAITAAGLGHSGGPARVARPAYGLARSSAATAEAEAAPAGSTAITARAVARSTALGQAARRASGTGTTQAARSAFAGRALRSALGTSGLALAAPPEIARALGLGADVGSAAGFSPGLEAASASFAPAAASLASRPLTRSARRGPVASSAVTAAPASRTLERSASVRTRTGTATSSAPTALRRALAATGPDEVTAAWQPPGAGGSLARAAARGAGAHQSLDLPAQRTAARAVATPAGAVRRSSLFAPALSLADAPTAARAGLPGASAPRGVARAIDHPGALTASPDAGSFTGSPTARGRTGVARSGATTAAPPSARALQRSAAADVRSPLRASGSPAARLVARRGDALGQGGVSVARSLSTAATLGAAPSLRRSRLPSFDPVFADAPVGREAVDSAPAGSSPLQRSTAPGSTAVVARSPLSRSLGRLGDPSATAGQTRESTVARSQRRAALATPGQARPLTSPLSRRPESSAPVGAVRRDAQGRTLHAPALGALPQLPGEGATTASGRTGVGSSSARLGQSRTAGFEGASTAAPGSRAFEGARTAAGRSLPTAGAPTATSRSASHAAAPVAHALSRAVESTAPVAASLQRGAGFATPRLAHRSSAATLAGLPETLIRPDLAGSEDVPGGAPRRARAAATRRDRGATAPTGAASSTALVARGDVRASRSTATTAPSLRRALQRDADVARRRPGMGFGLADELALPQQAEPASPGAEPADAAPARAHIGAPLVRQASGSVPPAQSLPRRTARRGETRTHRGPQIPGRALARLVELQNGQGFEGIEENTLASAAGLVDRAARRQAASSKSAQRSAHVTPVMALPEAEVRALVRKEIGELTTISAPAPGVHREVLEAAARLEEAAKVQRAPKGAPKGPSVAGKKDLEDFLRRAIRQIGVREDIERSRDLTPWD